MPRIRQLAAILISDEWPRDPSLGPVVLPGDVVDPHPGLAAAGASNEDSDRDSEVGDAVLSPPPL